jgi:hypothetical protein
VRAAQVSAPLSSFPAVGTDPERQQVLVLLENWVRVCHEITQTPAQSADKCRQFLNHLYQQVRPRGTPALGWCMGLPRTAEHRCLLW